MVQGKGGKSGLPHGGSGKSMNGLDWFLIGSGIVCFGRGIFRGAISQLFGIAGVIGGFLLAAHTYQSVAGQLSSLFPSLPAAPAISFCMLFLLTWVSVGMTGYLTGKLLRRTGLGFLDRLMGGAMGLVKALILAIVTTALLTLLLPPRSSLLAESTLTPYVQEAAELVFKATPKELQELFEEKQKAFRHHLPQRKEQSTEAEPFTKKASRF
jgi:membrane protein required for colicin V production